MSHIPSNAMPRAGDFPDDQSQSRSDDKNKAGPSRGLSQIADQIAGKAREYPKTSIAAGAAVAAGVVAAATISVRSRKSADDKSGKGKSAGKNKTSAKA